MEVDIASEVVNRINRYLQSRPWFDFEIMEYKGYRLTIMGGIDSSGPHEVEIWFEGVFFISGPMEWKTDTSSPPIRMISGEVAIELNQRFRVEQGHHIFSFAAEDYLDTSGCLLAARRIGFRLVSDAEHEVQ